MHFYLNNEYQSVEEFSYADCSSDDAYLQESDQSIYHTGKHINRESYMRAPVLLNLLNKLGKEIKREAILSILLLFEILIFTISINSIIQEHKY